MDILDILKKAAENQAADIFIVCGAVLSFKANGRMYELDGNALSPEDTKNLVLQIFHLAKRDITEEQLPEREKDFSLSVAGVGRFRVNIYKQRGSFSAVLRYVPFDLPDPAKLGIPDNRCGEQRQVHYAFVHSRPYQPKPQRAYNNNRGSYRVSSQAQSVHCQPARDKY